MCLPDRSCPGARGVACGAPGAGMAAGLAAALVAGMAAGLFAMTGCVAPAFRADLTSARTAQRVPALVDAADTQDASEPVAVETLIRQLDDPDAAVRLFAIGALHRRTDRRFGYRWYRDAEGRREAVAAWEAWAASIPPSAGGIPPSAG